MKNLANCIVPVQANFADGIGFIKSDADDFEEFDSRAWATNYTVTSLEGLFYKTSLDTFTWQYLLYRFAIYKRKSQDSNTTIKYKSFATVNNKNIPANTFRFFGRTVKKLSFMIGSSGNYAERTPY